jgi:hypothetical protein
MTGAGAFPPAIRAPTLTLIPHMYKGCTRDAQGVHKGVVRQRCATAKRVAKQGFQPVQDVRGTTGAPPSANRLWRQWRDTPM